MDHAVRDASADFIESLCAEYQKHNQIDPAFYERYRVKRGLRNADGTGVMAGVTQDRQRHGLLRPGRRADSRPRQRLVYRGIDVEELINGFVSEGRFGFEETATCFSSAPCHPGPAHRLRGTALRPPALPPMFTEDMILKAPSPM